MYNYLEFEKPVSDLEGEIRELRALADADGLDKETEANIENLKKKASRALYEIYDNLTPWQKVQVARHPYRPRFLDYVRILLEDFTPLSGDRLFAEDSAIIAGIGRFYGRSVICLGHEKGSDVATRIKHNFGMARPEGYRKVLRITDMASRFGLPVISIVDTPGAYPGVEAEQRGQAEAIAQSINAFLKLEVPSVAAIIGEGGSGGAVGIAATDSVLMLEHAIYSVISPEGAAVILWRDKSRAKEAATTMRITAQDLLRLGVIDEVIPEPTGGAHREPEDTIKSVGKAIADRLSQLSEIDPGEIRSHRQKKFLSMGRLLQDQDY